MNQSTDAQHHATESNKAATIAVAFICIIVIVSIFIITYKVILKSNNPGSCCTFTAKSFCIVYIAYHVVFTAVVTVIIIEIGILDIFHRVYCILSCLFLILSAIVQVISGWASISKNIAAKVCVEVAFSGVCQTIVFNIIMAILAVLYFPSNFLPAGTKKIVEFIYYFISTQSWINYFVYAIMYSFVGTQIFKKFFVIATKVAKTMIENALFYNLKCYENFSKIFAQMDSIDFDNDLLSQDIEQELQEIDNDLQNANHYVKDAKIELTKNDGLSATIVYLNLDLNDYEPKLHDIEFIENNSIQLYNAEDQKTTINLSIYDFILKHVNSFNQIVKIKSSFEDFLLYVYEMCKYNKGWLEKLINELNNYMTEQPTYQIEHYIEIKSLFNNIINNHEFFFMEFEIDSVIFDQIKAEKDGLVIITNKIQEKMANLNENDYKSPRQHYENLMSMNKKMMIWLGEYEHKMDDAIKTFEECFTEFRAFENKFTQILECYEEIYGFLEDPSYEISK